MDLYNMRTRVLPALLAAAPALALGLVALPYLPGITKLWSLLGVAVTTWAALIARKAGNRVQPDLYDAWDGRPTTARLRHRNSESAQVIQRRHRDVEAASGGYRLPTAQEEAANPGAADADDEEATRRVIARARNDPQHRLLNVENRNYGFARNLYGLKPFALAVCAVTLIATVALAAAVIATHHWVTATPLLVPLLVAIAALVLWTQVDPDFVRPQADAYSNRLLEAATLLATQNPDNTPSDPQTPPSTA